VTGLDNNQLQDVMATPVQLDRTENAPLLEALTSQLKPEDQDYTTMLAGSVQSHIPLPTP